MGIINTGAVHGFTGALFFAREWKDKLSSAKFEGGFWRGYAIRPTIMYTLTATE